MRNATELPIEPPDDDRADLVRVGRDQGRARSPLAELVARVVDEAPPLTPQQVANLAALLRRPVDQGEHR